MPNTSTVIQFATAATRGDRNYQEDTCNVRAWTAAASGDPATAPLAGVTLAVLADGMGGHAGGEIASRLVCEHLAKGFEQLRPTLSARLIAGLEAANGQIAQTVDDDPALQNMGSTVIACAFSPLGIEWISVGDSPLFLVRRGEVSQLNADHSMAPVIEQMVADGRMSRAEADADGRRHMLRSAVTGEEFELIDVSKQPLRLGAGDVVILASDGIETLSSDEVVDVITSALEADLSADAMARALISSITARRRPHQDNATVIVAKVG